jgi:hypothetical protein
MKNPPGITLKEQIHPKFKYSAKRGMSTISADGQSCRPSAVLARKHSNIEGPRSRGQAEEPRERERDGLADALILSSSLKRTTYRARLSLSFYLLRFAPEKRLCAEIISSPIDKSEL